jgi:hypothetical protein
MSLASNLISKLTSVLGVTLVAVLLDLVAVYYVMSHGFSPTSPGITFGGISLQLQWFPVLGVLIVAAAVTYDAFTRVFPRWLGPEVDPTARLRFVKMVVFSLVAFVCLLYVPYLLGSGLFWRHLSEASHAVGQLRGFGSWLENVELPILSLDPVWQFATTQLIASGALVFFAWVFARPTRRTKKLR